MKPILVLDCGSRSIDKLVAAVRAETGTVMVRTVPIQGIHAPMDAHHPVLTIEDLSAIEPSGIVISGTPHYLYTMKGRIPPDDFFANVLDLGLPILGICGGHELLAHLIVKHHAAGKTPRVVGANPSREYEPVTTRDNPCVFKWYIDQPVAFDQGKYLFQGLSSQFPVWMYHIHQVRMLPPYCTSIGGTPETPHGAISYSPPSTSSPRSFGVQFHPELSPLETRHAIFSNFTTLCKENV